MKKNLKIIFLLLAVVGILVIALLLIFCNVSLADVSLDTFIGVMVTMIGILVNFCSWVANHQCIGDKKQTCRDRETQGGNK